VKHLKSSLRDLRRIFERSITVRDIAEAFASFDATQAAHEVRQFMEAREFDVVGVRREGLPAGYIRRTDLSTGTLSDHITSFDNQVLLPENASLLRAFEALRTTPRFLVTVMDQVWGIVTRGDLQKTPVRMWLFGLISLLEMQLLRLIRLYYPDDQWKSQISEGRMAQAVSILEDRRRRNEAIDLADCLQLADKRTIVAKTDSLKSLLGFPSRAKADETLGALEQLRNDLAHAQDVIAGRWPYIVDLAETAEDLLRRCEETGASNAT
jgi:hypothetical protein